MTTKVLMFGWEFPPHNTGGLGPACLGITKSLAKLGVDLTFVLPKKLDYGVTSTKMLFAPDTLKTILPNQIPDLENLNVEVVAVNSLLWPYAEPQSYLNTLAAFPNSNSSITQIYAPNLEAEVQRYALMVNQVLQDQEFDIIHAHDWLTFPAALKAKQISQKPLVVHIHSTEFDRSGSTGNNRIFEIEKQAMQAADRVITVSEHTKRVVIEHYQIDPDKIVAIHNGVELIPLLDTNSDINQQNASLKQSLEHFKQNGYDLVLFVGRLTYQKGVEYLLKAAQKALQFNPKTIFIIAGSGDMENHLIHLSASLGISDKVIFTGFLRGTNLDTLYKMADLFVMPSISEPFGLVGLESLLNQTPVIFSKTSGVGEVIQNALKVDFWDVDAFASMIVSVLDHDSLKQTLTSFGHAEAKSATWDKAGEKIKNLYNLMLETDYASLRA